MHGRASATPSWWSVLAFVKRYESELWQERQLVSLTDEALAWHPQTHAQSIKPSAVVQL
jgi:hypothetical protein